MTRTTRSSAAHEAIVANLDQQAEIEQDIVTVKNQLTEYGYRRDELSRRIADVKNAIGGCEQNEERYGATLAEARRNLHALTEERTELDVEIGASEVRAGQLKDRLAAIPSGCQANAVSAHHQAIVDAEGRLDEIDALIAEHDARLADARRIADPIAPLMHRREDLLAAISQGEAGTADLEQLDAEIDAVSKKHEQQIAQREGVIEQAGQTIAGLRRRREGAAADLERLRPLAPKVLDQFLGSETARVVIAFARHAEQLAADLTRVAALEHLRDTNGHRTTGTAIPIECGKTYIPALADPQEAGRIGRAHTQPVLVGADLIPGSETLRAALSEETRRVAEIGITGP